MSRDQYRKGAGARRRTAHIVVRGEFGPSLSAALPDSKVTAESGQTHVTIQVRDDSELFGVLERLRDLGAELVSVSTVP